jgi:hypothetical protein
MLGVMKAGGAFILPDPSQPVLRLKTLCQHAGWQWLQLSRWL